MKNLGNILLFLLLAATTSFANVSAKVSPSVIYEGESAIYTLSITGNKVQKPDLFDICGNDITSTSSQQNIQLINGSYTTSNTFSYEFTPIKSCVIPEVEVEVDGKKELSNSVELRVEKMKRDPNAEFSLTFTADKKELYVGEPFELTLLLKQREGALAVDSKFIAPEFKGFWKKSESKPQRFKDAEFIITKVVYTLAAQRAGLLTIESAKLKIAKRVGQNNWGTLIPQVRWRTYSSNTIDVTVKELPNNAKIVGDFTISATVQKTVVNPNEAVNLTLEVRGNGNLEDIESFKPYIAGVNVFDEKIDIQGDRLQQKLVFVGDNNFTIPAFELVYFDIKTQQVRKIKTEPIKITVSGAPKTTAPLKVTRDINTNSDASDGGGSIEKITVEKNNYWYIAFAFLSGLVIGITIMLFKPNFGQDKVKKFNLKDEKLLLIKLLPFKEEDSDVAEIVKVLERNLYGESKVPLDKKLLKELVKRYKLA